MEPLSEYDVKIQEMRYELQLLSDRVALLEKEQKLEQSKTVAHHLVRLYYFYFVEQITPNSLGTFLQFLEKIRNKTADVEDNFINQTEFNDWVKQSTPATFPQGITLETLHQIYKRCLPLSFFYEDIMSAAKQKIFLLKAAQFQLSVEFQEFSNELELILNDLQNVKKFKYFDPIDEISEDE